VKLGTAIPCHVESMVWGRDVEHGEDEEEGQ
jgi:hypothetical protein